MPMENGGALLARLESLQRDMGRLDAWLRKQEELGCRFGAVVSEELRHSIDDVKRELINMIEEVGSDLNDYAEKVKTQMDQQNKISAELLESTSELTEKVRGVGTRVVPLEEICTGITDAKKIRSAERSRIKTGVILSVIASVIGLGVWYVQTRASAQIEDGQIRIARAVTDGVKAALIEIEKSKQGGEGR